jgi:hypothetical protein
VRGMFMEALGRPPSDTEMQRFTHAAINFAVHHKVEEKNLLNEPVVWREMAHTLFNLKEFITIP